MSDGLTDMRSQTEYQCYSCKEKSYNAQDFYFAGEFPICLKCFSEVLKNSTGIDMNTKNKTPMKHDLSIAKVAKIKEDNVNHPSHYTAYKGVKVIQLTEQMNFNRGNAVKYICRAGLKNKDKEVEDLQKAIWYLNREIERIQKD